MVSNGLSRLVEAEKDFQHCRKMVDDAVRQAADFISKYQRLNGATSMKNDEQWATKVQWKAL